jgi:prepilin-type N-terminal cleavage/methylation domain-containing protein/prepilin-type processing-associated H-X9-DG protein
MSRSALSRIVASGAVPVRRGFTLVEMLVVITIIGILVSMLLPAVNQVREAGRQTSCKNNLRQIALAMDSYNTKNGSLPYGEWYDAVTEGKTWHQTEYNWNCLVLILPFIDQMSLYSAFEFTPKKVRDREDYPVVPGSNPRITAQSFRISMYVCPSDSSHGVRPGTTIALNSYVGSAGSVTVSATGDSTRPCLCSQPYNTYYPKPSPKLPGPFRVHRTSLAANRPATTYAMIRDGLSNTIMLGEMRYGCSPYAESAWCRSINGSGIVSTIIPINADTCEGVEICSQDGCKSRYNYSMSMGFGGWHPGGANFAMCDQSVHFLSEGIDHQMYQYLGACNDGQPTRVP